MSVKLLTFNCRGLGGMEKRRDVLNYLKQKNFSIYMLQDTHFTNDDLHLARSIWGYEIFISPGKSDSRGVATLFNNNFEFKVNKTEHDNNGNYLIIDMTIENKYNILLINIYDPNRDSPVCYKY